MNSKMNYSPPTFCVYEVKLEYSITAASARIDPLDANQDITETWIEDPDDRKTFTW